jgi:glucokinase
MPPTLRKSFIGLDVGGTNIKVLAFNPDGKVIAEEGMTTSEDGTKAWLDRARAAVHSVIARCPASAMVGVAAPGLPARDGHSAFMPAGCRAWKDWIGNGARTGFAVPILNDARGVARRSLARRGQGCDERQLLTLGTGVGGAALVDGKILRGHFDRADISPCFLIQTGRVTSETPGSLEDAIR